MEEKKEGRQRVERWRGAGRKGEDRTREEAGGREEEIVPPGIRRKTRGMLAQSVNAQMRKAK